MIVLCYRGTRYQKSIPIFEVEERQIQGKYRGIYYNLGRTKRMGLSNFKFPENIEE